MNLKAEIMAMVFTLIMAAFGAGYLAGYASAPKLEMPRGLESK